MSVNRIDRQEDRLSKGELEPVLYELTTQTLELVVDSPAFQKAAVDSFLGQRARTQEGEPAILLSTDENSYRLSYTAINDDSSLFIERLAPGRSGSVISKNRPEVGIALNYGAHIVKGKYEKRGSSLWYREFDPDSQTLKIRADDTPTGLWKTREFLAKFAEDIRTTDTEILRTRHPLVDGATFSEG